MTNLSISIFGNQIIEIILAEIKLFSKYHIKFYNDLNLLIKNINQKNGLIIFFLTELNQEEYYKLIKLNFPLIVITNHLFQNKILSGEFVEKINAPFYVLYLEKKIISLFARYEFNKSSLINLGDYIIDKNERRIKKKDLELQLTEKEINFLILFSKTNKPVSKNFVLKHVWNYSLESDTHTVETHIHRLRKKISQKFNDNNFIKNTDKGYYI